MTRLTRRRLLAAGSFAATGGLSGCNSVLGDDATVCLCEIGLDDNDPEAHRFHLLVEADGEPVHLDSCRVTDNPDTSDYTLLNPQEWLSNQPSTLSLFVKLDDNEKFREREITPSSAGCRSRVVIRVNEGSLHFIVSDVNVESCNQVS